MAHLDDPTTQRANLRYIRQAMDEPLLERTHELNLASKWKDKRDEKALHELIRSYTRLVVAIAAKFKNYGLPMGDLIQEGNIGLMEAAARFEPALENRFSTYATWWIRAQIQDYVLRNWSIVRTGTTASQKSLFFNLRRLRAKIQGQSARDFLDDDAVTQIAKELGVDKKEVISMEARMNGGDQSLNAPIGEEGDNEWQDLLADKHATPEQVVIGMKDNATRSTWLNEALGELSDRERTIIEERRMNDDVVTLEDLGKQLGISKERVRQLEQRAMDKLRASILIKVQDAGLDAHALFETA
ncbi:MAG TPA: RNA polymerase factor sigma-32 [Patescibacteria group bacterium]|nr:RNA polymerase factor sigma-32 [Patescibacteria group bacterium]